MKPQGKRILIIHFHFCSTQLKRNTYGPKFYEQPLQSIPNKASVSPLDFLRPSSPSCTPSAAHSQDNSFVTTTSELSRNTGQHTSWLNT